MADVLLYIRLWIWGHFFALAGGCVLTVLVGWIEKWQRKQVSTLIYGGIIILLLFGAGYKTWSDEHSTVTSRDQTISRLLTTINDSSKPQFKLRFDLVDVTTLSRLLKNTVGA
jgi:hypothetical protein